MYLLQNKKQTNMEKYIKLYVFKKSSAFDLSWGIDKKFKFF